MLERLRSRLPFLPDILPRLEEVVEGKGDIPGGKLPPAAALYLGTIPAGTGDCISD